MSSRMGARPTPPSVRVRIGAAASARTTAEPTCVIASAPATARVRRTARREPTKYDASTVLPCPGVRACTAPNAIPNGRTASSASQSASPQTR